MPADSATPVDRADVFTSVVVTHRLHERPARAPDYAAEARALAAIVHALAHSPASILDRLIEVGVELCAGHSAGISLLKTDGSGAQQFYWPAISGRWAGYVGGTTPRNFSPCGVVLDRNAPQLVASPERYYDWLHAADPPIVECLLAPFYVDGEAAGTVWVVSHDGARSFDAEDARRLGSLARCASGAYQVASSLDPVTAARAAASSITDEMKRVRSLADGATAAAHPPPLSRREREVVKLVAQGHGNNSIAETLGLSVKSVETYRARAVNKLGASTRAELVSYARGHGLL